MTPRFYRVFKKLQDHHLNLVDQAIRKLAIEPLSGIAKKGDLASVYVYKFKVDHQELLLSYQINDSEIILLALGSHENFYRDLKR